MRPNRSSIEGWEFFLPTVFALPHGYSALKIPVRFGLRSLPTTRSILPFWIRSRSRRNDLNCWSNVCRPLGLDDDRGAEKNFSDQSPGAPFFTLRIGSGSADRDAKKLDPARQPRRLI